MNAMSTSSNCRVFPAISSGACAIGIVNSGQSQAARDAR